MLPIMLQCKQCVTSLNDVRDVNRLIGIIALSFCKQNEKKKKKNDDVFS